jgi:1,4-dihydroxy-2-naphthoate octaprenyltransferase
MGTLLALVTIPLAIAAVRGALRHHDDPARIVPALGLNVATVLVTDALLALGFLIG